MQSNQLPGSQYLPAQVPGSVYNDLLQNKQMEDPFWRDNEDKAFELLEHDYEYQATFSVSQKMLGMDKILLRCDGIDTLAEITVNNVFVAAVDNMHRTWEFDVSKIIKKDKNEIKIIFRSPIKFAGDAHEKNKIGGASECLDGFPQLRKAHCMFGWDWGPRLPDAGIWRDISLVGIRLARIDNVYITQKHKKGSVELDFSVEIENAVELPRGAEYSWELIITDPKGNPVKFDKSNQRIVIENPQLWWPNGYGAQPLYTVKLILLSPKGKELDRWERRIGLRTMTVKRQKDKWGESFAHEVNGVAIFAMGADYIPEDNILSRVTPKRTRKLLEQCVLANFNTVRVWGGGYYPDDYFFDICDELGLVVWQDFMFCCAVYDLTDEFDQNIRAELTDNIKRIRHHACLGLWCGNNEMEMFVDWMAYSCTPKQKADYIKMYEYIFPQVVKEFDPQTFYWPASPSSGGSFDKPNDPDRGDVHYWDVWHGNKPFTEYRKFHFRYLAEFGFQGFPSLETIKTFTDDPDDLNPFSYIMERHQRNGGANGKIMNYMSATYRYPKSFSEFIFASQLLQADAIRYGVEHFRRHRGRCMGAVYWQLNDCWPVISWSSIDYCGRWKALHYAAKRFFAPLMISCQEEGALTCEADLNWEHYYVDKTFRLNVANETRADKVLTVRWALRTAKGEILEEQEEPVSVPALTSSWLDSVVLPEMDERTGYISYELEDNGQICSRGTVLLTLPKYFAFEDPQLSYTVDDDVITVSAKAYAKSVEIRNEKDDLILEDNFFDLNGDSRSVKVLSGEIDTIYLRSANEIGRN